MLKLGAQQEGAYALHVPIESPAAQSARLVIDSPGVDAVWLDGKLVGKRRGTREVELNLPAGPSDLNLRVWAKSDEGLVITLVSDQPVSFARTRAQ